MLNSTNYRFPLYKKGWAIADNGANYHPKTGRFSATRHGVHIGNSTLEGLLSMIELKDDEFSLWGAKPN